MENIKGLEKYLEEMFKAGWVYEKYDKFDRKE